MDAAFAEFSAALRARPEFPAAARAFISQLAEWRVRIGPRNRVFSNLSRFYLVAQILFLHFAHELGAAEAEATITRLHAFSEAGQGVGLRGLRGALRLMQSAGLVGARPSPSDRRAQVCFPTPALMQLVADYFGPVFGLVDALWPGSELRARVKRDETFLARFFGRLGLAVLESGATLFRNREESIFRLLSLGGSNSVVAATIDCYWRGEPLPSHRDLAARFNVSESQVRNILELAQAECRLRLGAKGAVLDAEPLIEDYLRIHLDFLAFYVRFGLQTETWGMLYANENGGPVAGAAV